MPILNISVPVNTEALVDMVLDLSDDELLDFILQIDQGMVDLDFTKKLVKKLKKRIRVEEEVKECCRVLPSSVPDYPYGG